MVTALPAEAPEWGLEWWLKTSFTICTNTLQRQVPSSAYNIENTELLNIGGLFRNTIKKGDVYYSGKSEDGDQYVLFRNAYWKEGAEPAKPYFRLMKRVPKGSAPSAMND